MPAGLLIVDVQYDFLPGGALAVPNSDEMLPVVHTLLKGRWDFVSASQDFHPPGHISFASAHEKEPFTSIDVPWSYAKDVQPATLQQMLWPDHCIQGTHGAAIEDTVHSDLREWINRGQGVIVQKGTDLAIESYSAFACLPPASPIMSPLSQALLKHNIDTLFVIGLATDYCVRHSALDAKRAGFDVYVIEEGIRAVGGAEATDATFAEWQTLGIRVVKMEDPVVNNHLA